MGWSKTKWRAGGERHPGEPLRTSGQSVQKSDKQNAPARHKVAQAHEIIYSFMYCEISYSQSDWSDGGTSLFLADEDYGGSEKEKRTRQYLPDTAVS